MAIANPSEKPGRGERGGNAPRGASIKGAPSPPPQASTDLEVLVRARYPLLYVVTWEEERALAEIGRVGESLGKKMFDWTISNGLVRYRASLEGRSEGRKDTKDPIVALKELLTITEPSIFVLRDFHDFMQNSEVKRRLRDLASILRSSLSTVIIVSPLLRLPEELEKDITIIDFPLPSRAELSDLIHQISADIAGNPGLSIDLSQQSLDAVLDAAIGLTLNEAENVFAKTLVQARRLSGAESEIIYSEKQQIIRKSGLLEYISTRDSLSAVGGPSRGYSSVAPRPIPRRLISDCRRREGCCL
jgi:hypothetical protein